MPELPEVETVRRTLARHIVGATITAVHIRRSDFVQGNAAVLAGRRVDRLDRVGKELAIVLDGGPVVLVHLGMSGQVLWHHPSAAVAENRHDHVIWSLASGARVVFNDPRRFGGLWVFASDAELAAQRWSRLGPDALAITGDQLRVRLATTRRAVKAALLDQHVLAGVGNIYADEALWRAGITPRRRASALSAAQCDRLADSLRAVLLASIDAGGSTLRDFADAAGQPGSYRSAHAVYGRGGEPCTRCGRTLKQAVVAGRTTVWCPGCQQAR